VKLFLTDPPYNIGHKYGDVSDRLPKDEYHKLIKEILSTAYEVADDSAHFFMIHYPERIAEMWKIITEGSRWKFKQWITWVYPSNIGMTGGRWTRASRTILWLVKNEGGEPPFYPNRIVRPYRNPWDSRVSKLMGEGKMGCKLYDWWEINLTKNVNKEKSNYSNQIPEILLERIIISTTDVGDLVADPFAGTYSTIKAALRTGRFGWGCDKNKETKDFWPENDILASDYEDTNFNFDIDYGFDYVRAGISRSQFDEILKNGVINLSEKNRHRASKKLKDELERMSW